MVLVEEAIPLPDRNLLIAYSVIMLLAIVVAITVVMERAVRSTQVTRIQSLRTVYLTATMQPAVVQSIFLETLNPLHTHLPTYVILNLPIIQLQMEEATLPLRKVVHSRLGQSAT